MAKQTIISKEIPIKKNQTQGFTKALLFLRFILLLSAFTNLCSSQQRVVKCTINRITNIPSDALRKKDPSFKLLFYTVFCGNRCIHKPIIDLKKQIT